MSDFQSPLMCFQGRRFGKWFDNHSLTITLHRISVEHGQGIEIGDKNEIKTGEVLVASVPLGILIIHCQLIYRMSSKHQETRMDTMHEQIQMMFQELHDQAGIPLIELDEGDSCILQVGEEMMLYIHIHEIGGMLDFCVPLETVPETKRAEVYGHLLGDNLFSIATYGATFALDKENNDCIILQFQEKLSTLTTERLGTVLENFLVVAEYWKSRLNDYIDKATETAVTPKEDEDEFPYDIEPEENSSEEQNFFITRV